MITDLHILKGLHNVIKKYFPKIPIVDKDYKGVERPAFYITDISRKDVTISSEFFESTKSFNITYFGGDKKTGNMELVKIKEFLANIFIKPIKIQIQTKKEVKKLFYVEVDDIDIRVNRNENYVSCDLLVVIQQRKINVFIEEHEQIEDSIIVDYENNLDSDNFNTELMQNIVSKTEIKKDN